MKTRYRVALATLLVGGALLPRAGEATPRRVAQVPGSTTVNVYGKAETFGGLETADTPSGHSLTQNPVTGFQFAPGRMPFMTTVANDGSVFMGGMDQNASNVFGTSPNQVIAVFDPASGSYTNIKMKTSAGKEEVLVDDIEVGTPEDSELVDDVPIGGASVADVRPIRDGSAIAFTSWTTLTTNSFGVDGVWPVFGILTKVGGQWQVAGGTGWTNQWTGAQLRASTLPTGPGPAACPVGSDPDFPGQSDCNGLNEMAVFPNGDILITQYSGESACSPTQKHGGFVIVRPGAPDASGRFQPVVVAQETITGAIPDLTTVRTEDCVGVSPIGVDTDPTSTTATDLRFVAMHDLFTDPPTPGSGEEASEQPTIVQEYSYNSTAGAITPVSAPVFPGDTLPSANPQARELWGFSGALYDHAGTLWVTRNRIWAGGNLAVFPKVGGQRRLSSTCPAVAGLPLGDYRTTNTRGTATTADDVVVWGKPCKPNNDIVQPKALGFSGGLAEDPVSHDIVSVHGQGIVAVRPVGSGATMDFRVGSVVDLGIGLLPKGTPEGPGTGIQQWSGAIDGQHRLWTSTYVIPPATWPVVVRPTDKPPFTWPLVEPNQATNSWLHSVAIDDLFDPPATALSDADGGLVGLHAEVTSTNTTSWSAGAGADREFDSTAYVVPCAGGCSDTDFNPGNGFVLADDDAPGLHLGQPVTYKLSVPSPGYYSLGFFTSTSSTSNARIQAQVGANSVITDVSHPSTAWAYKTSPSPLYFSAAGTVTLTLSSPAGGAPWKLNWLALTRVAPP